MHRTSAEAVNRCPGQTRGAAIIQEPRAVYPQSLISLLLVSSGFSQGSQGLYAAHSAKRVQSYKFLPEPSHSLRIAYLGIMKGTLI